VADGMGGTVILSNVTMKDTIFEPGRNCTAVAPPPRAAFIVDAENYFLAFMRAAERAERSLTILGWDFDSRTPLCNEDGKECILLGDFLNDLAARKRQLRIRVLNWDYPIVFGADREIPPTLGISWKPHRRIDFRFDDTHPVAGSHHQKIVVVDDVVAFAGGLDLTNKRWDTRGHTAADPRRVFDGKPYPPFHDIMMVVDGEAACELARVAYGRWVLGSGAGGAG
jgi:phospholipase D1/2